MKENKVVTVLKKEPMLSVSLLAAIISMIITKPSAQLLQDIDWKTLGTLLMMLSVLEGFKQESIFNPILNLARKIKTQRGLTFFLVFCVFFSSMFVTNDVSLIIFVPITIILFRAGNKEKYIIPVLTFENIAAVRGSLLMPFGSPQNLFLYSQSGHSALTFITHMSPLWVSSGLLLCVFICFLYRKDPKQSTGVSDLDIAQPWQAERSKNRFFYIALFAIVITSIVTRTKYWPYVTLVVVGAIAIFDHQILTKKVDYVLLLTFLCFFVFSSSICANPTISGFLSNAVAGYEYWWGILLSQLISNVPASIVLWPFTKNLAALLYGVDSAGLVSLIGSLASVINFRIYAREYPGKGLAFIKGFTLISLCFFAIVVVPGYLLSSWQF
ncbi:MAG: hypothetical protein HUK23_00145 [Sphaerochaetaceae bacterium]|nr:hypothetical protein [Sphaerochaetaceae bacterium]